MAFSNYLIETKFTKIMNALRGDVPHINQLGIITAQNPMGEQSSPQQNNLRNRELLKILKNANYQGYPIDPKWIVGKFGNLENGYFVPHIARLTLITLGAKFGQKAVIWGSKVVEDNKPFIRFEYIETSMSQEPVTVDSYQTTQTRNVVVSGSGVQDRDDYFSAMPYPPDLKDKRQPERMVTPRKFAVPFFDPDYERAKYSDDKQSISHEVFGDISFNSVDLPDRPDVQDVLQEIRQKEADLFVEGKISSWYWRARGSLEVSLEKLRDVLTTP